ncbi:hypothetical protein I7I53_03353 [Histoplasma capsulatum var. duboisii H88]|uniref:Uncharacterized protein n=1 Tax=Ajellomyces capsulatus (strain H88) TaxID=544711 RepID=A0A8A1LND8_AJEC8|nr:hypothetical protein I7I53_03353 [Histoplasma capsulatum var. duboisii H88]
MALALPSTNFPTGFPSLSTIVPCLLHLSPSNVESGGIFDPSSSLLSTVSSTTAALPIILPSLSSTKPRSLTVLPTMSSNLPSSSFP